MNIINILELIIMFITISFIFSCVVLFVVKIFDLVEFIIIAAISKIVNLIKIK